ncbi:hypothetical protein ACTFIY_008534 [Dictyostelium cf. discoideum]
MKISLLNVKFVVKEFPRLILKKLNLVGTVKCLHSSAIEYEALSSNNSFKIIDTNKQSLKKYINCNTPSNFYFTVQYNGCGHLTIINVQQDTDERKANVDHAHLSMYCAPYGDNSTITILKCAWSTFAFLFIIPIQFNN